MSTIPFLLSFEPYQPPVGSRVINSVDDMVVISFNPPSQINYAIGTDVQYNDTIIVNNVTSNAILEIKIEFNGAIFEINTTNTTSPYVFRVDPGKQIALPVTLKQVYFDTRANTTPVTTPINFTVRNLSNGTVVLKNV